MELYKPNQEQQDFLNWVLKNFDLPTAAVYKVKNILKHKSYNKVGQDILNNIREIYGEVWRQYKKRRGLVYGVLEIGEIEEVNMDSIWNIN